MPVDCLIDPDTFRTPEDEPMLQAIRDQSVAFTSPELLYNKLLEIQLHAQEMKRRIEHPRMMGSLEWKNDVVRSVCFGLFEAFQGDFVKLVPMKYPVQSYMLPNDTDVRILAERFAVGRYANNTKQLAVRIVEIIGDKVRELSGSYLRPLVGVAILPYIVVASRAEDERGVDTRFGFHPIVQDDLP